MTTDHLRPPGWHVLPEIIFGPITRGCWRSTPALPDHNLIHIDSDVAKKAACRCVRQGMLSFGVLARVPTNGGSDRLKSFGARSCR